MTTTMDESLLRQYPELEREHFWWVSRWKFITGLLAPNASSGAALEVLDVGCGSGMLAQLLSETGARVTGVDVESHPEWSGDSRSVSFSEGDYLDLSSSLGEFDTVLALDVIEHIEDDVAFVCAIRDNTMLGGSVIVTVPAYSWLWSEHDQLNHHFRRYTKQSLMRLLAAAGLTVSRCGYIFFGLVLPKLLVKNLEKISGSPDSVERPPRVFNRMALAYFELEHQLAAKRKDFLPAGTSVVAVAHRDT